MRIRKIMCSVLSAVSNLSTGEQIDYTSMVVVFLMFTASAVCLYLSLRKRREA